VEAAVAALEDDEAFNAGRGSVLTADGRVQLDAMIMDGATLAVGAVAAVETISNPVSLARLVMDRLPQVLLVGEGAERFARAQGIATVDNATLVTDRRRTRARGDPPTATLDPGHDTVGAVARDRYGNVAAATSTGGIAGKPAGRVGDSPIPGAGGYADNELAAISCTGEGEAMIRLVLAKWVADRVGEGRAPQEAADAAIQRLGTRLGAEAGLIVLDRTGRWGVAFNAPCMAWAVMDGSGAVAQVASRPPAHVARRP